jgi:hypothetical protein
MQHGEEDGPLDGKLEAPVLSRAVRTLSIEQACQSRWKIRAGPILALRVVMLSPRTRFPSLPMATIFPSRCISRPETIWLLVNPPPLANVVSRSPLASSRAKPPVTGVP